MGIGKRVRGLREERGLTQKDLKEATGLSQATISRIESGEFNNLRGNTVIKLADALRVTTDYLLGRTDASGPQHIFGADLGAKALLNIHELLGMEDKRMLESFAEFLEMRAKDISTSV